ncbi:hypothetical protein THIX_30118 [Thiomonas sp. X19]|nr:hypothetical protein THIX_30118 [Thiomonas sp. X19]
MVDAASQGNAGPPQVSLTPTWGVIGEPTLGALKEAGHPLKTVYKNS